MVVVAGLPGPEAHPDQLAKDKQTKFKRKEQSARGLFRICSKSEQHTYLFRLIR